MPYNIKGETKSQTSSMESCVSKVMARGGSKASAIAICKKSLGFTNEMSIMKKRAK